MYLFVLIVSAFSLCSLNIDCPIPPSEDAQEIINKVIRTHGGKLYAESKIAFVFRGRQYSAIKTDSGFEYSRSFSDSTGNYVDLLNNNGFVRTVNGEALKLSKKQSRRYTNSLNSVVYFAYLPYGLNDPAAQKKYLRETEIEGEPYHLIQVTFSEEGGGEDFEDIFYYWIHKDKYTLDYLAYLFHVNKGGLRFRKAINPREVNGIKFVDYINYKADHNEFEIGDLEELFKNNELEEVSRIELVDITVSRL